MANSTSCNKPLNTLQCMACNCFHEAGSSQEPDAGRLAVHRAVLTRYYSGQYKNKGVNSVCGVIWAKGQFKWIENDFNFSVPSNHSCFRLARQALAEPKRLGADSFHSGPKPKGWSHCRPANPYTIGSHKFYTCRKIANDSVVNTPPSSTSGPTTNASPGPRGKSSRAGSL